MLKYIKQMTSLVAVLAVLIVFGTGLFGSILGLSTLSFVSEPSDHLNNVVIGGAWGIILGVGIVAYSQAEKSKDYYYENSYNTRDKMKKFNTFTRMEWHKSSHDSLGPKKQFSPIAFNYLYNF